MPHLAKASTSTTASDIHSADYTSPSSVDDHPSQLRALDAGTPISPLTGLSFLGGATSKSSKMSRSRQNSVQTSSMKEQDWDAQSIRSTKSTKSLKSLKNWRSKSKEEAKRKTQFYEDQFAYKDGWDTHTVDQARAISPIIAELRTNVIIKDEYSLVTELSGHFASRFQRPESSVMITIAHSACLMYGGTFEPAYMLTLSAVESHCQPATNKRNTALTQSFLSDVLGVTPDRGVVRFHPIRDDCLATNARTVAGEIDKLEQEQNGGIRKVLTNGRRKSSSGASIKRKNTNASEYVALPAEPVPKSTDRKMSVADKRKSFASVGGFKNPDDTKDKAKKNRMSLHPPDVNELSDHSSGSSTPEISAPVFLSSNGQQADRNYSQTVPSQNGAHAPDQTHGLLNEASRKLSSISPPPTTQIGASVINSAPQQPSPTSFSQPKPGYTNHSRPTSRSQSTPTNNNKSLPPQHASQLLQDRPTQQSQQQPQQSQHQQHQHITQQQRQPAAQQNHQNPQPQYQSQGGQYTSRPGTQNTLPPPPAIPVDKPLPQKISKRKSLISIFRGKSSS